MDNFFYKLPVSADVASVSTDVGSLEINGEFLRPQKYGLALAKTIAYEATPNRSYTARASDAERVIRMLPKSLLKIETPKLWVLDIQEGKTDRAMLSPHIDGVRLCAINFYWDTNGETTHFYEYAFGGKITEVCSFVAAKGDVYVLDVNKPHAVTLVPGKKRRVVSLSFIDTAYDVVVQHIKTHGLHA